ncbi:hypothetical protein C8T65DRAFT_745488 [Cerioporus squamosus]|nr:hypothetical protein C8T65DRAFT_745488 [Cerioporus squamosus]
MAPTTTATPPGLTEATRNSTTHWQDDLQALFDHAKDRFADVVWELQSDSGNGAEEVWGHKAVVYARAPPSFQARYFSFKPPPIASPTPYSSSPTGTLPAQSALSLNLGVDFSAPSRSPSPSPFRVTSPTPSTAPGALLRLPTNINPTLFSNELEYLYTGKGWGEAFEFLFDSAESEVEGDGEEARLDKLRKDLVFMWRSRLYSDVRISLTGTFSSTNHESATAIFSSHRFILVSRSPYFSTQLLQWGVKPPAPGEPLTLNLPSPPFTPASLHFTLGFIYTGTLVFSHRTFDLDTAFHIMRSATYLSLDTLYDEIQARIVQEMMHGLFHAFLEFSEYEAITGGKWGTGGCRCRQCARRAPRVLEFSVLDDVKNPHLERGARRALVGLFGEGWCTSEFAALPQKTRDALLKGLGKRTTPMNVFALLAAAQAALKKLDTIIETWGDTVREMVLAARKTIDDVVCSQAAECFEQQEWLEIMEADGVRFEDGEKVERLLDSLRRGLNEKNAPMAYQAVVDSVLLRPHPNDPEAALLSSTSHVRVQAEQARMDIVRYIRRRWLTIKQDDGFACMEPWAAREIATELELQSEAELMMPTTPSSTARGGKLTVRNGPVSRTDESDTVSLHSMRSVARPRSVAGRDPVRSSAVSVRSVARSTHSTVSRTSTTTLARRVPLSPSSLRPDSKLTPAMTTPSPSRASLADGDRARSPLSPSPSPIPRNSMSTANVRKSTASSIRSTATTDRPPRPKSVAASIKSTRSTASTIRKGVAGPSTLRTPSGSSRASTLSSSATSTTSASENSTAFETARSELTASNVARTRTSSAASNVSTRSTHTTGASTPRIPKRPPSVASRTTPSIKGKPAVEPPKLPVAKRTASTASVRSTISTKSTATRKSIARSTSGTAPPTPSKPSTPAKTNGKTLPPEQDENDAGGTIKAKPKSLAAHAREKQGSVVSSSSASTVRESLKRKSSADTIREATTGNPAKLPRGATLDIGIPCIISSKKARFRAYARYIGEVEGEQGPWVGVEVPMSDAWPGDKLDGRQWNDGTWGGIRYFEIGSAAEWDFGQDSMARRRRNDWLSSLGKDGKGSLKREGDQLSIERAKRLRSVSPAVSDMSSSESRGLFVRPQQVLYVVDAVGADL